jgi:Flp pilus assembly protein TadG
VITTRLLRVAIVVVVLVLAGFIALEVHWSLDAKTHARHTADAAALAAAQELARSHDSLAARHVAEARSAVGPTRLVAFDIDATGTVRVTVSGHSRSYLLRRFGPARTITDINVTGSAARQ